MSIDKMESRNRIIPPSLKIVIGFLFDVLLLPVAGVILFAGKCFKTNFDPKRKNIKQGLTPILLVHGSNFNEIQWLFGRWFLSRQKEVGSVFTLNLDGLILNDPKNGIEDYAEKLKKKIAEIQCVTGRRDLILGGHSMGGLVSAWFTENLAKENACEVKKVITIATPWQVPPLLKMATAVTQKIAPSLFKNPKRFQQMRDDHGELKTLRKQVSASNVRYYSIYVRGDIMVPDERGKLEVGKSRGFDFHGHFTPMTSISVWNQIATWIAE